MFLNGRKNKSKICGINRRAVEYSKSINLDYEREKAIEKLTHPVGILDRWNSNLSSMAMGQTPEPCTTSPIRFLPAVQMCNANAENRCIPYMINWRSIIRTTNTQITETPMGHTSYATSPRKTTRDMVDKNIQRVGMREDKEKKAYESYISRERY